MYGLEVGQSNYVLWKYNLFFSCLFFCTSLAYQLSNGTSESSGTLFYLEICRDQALTSTILSGGENLVLDPDLDKGS